MGEKMKSLRILVVIFVIFMANFSYAAKNGVKISDVDGEHRDMFYIGSGINGGKYNEVVNIICANIRMNVDCFNIESYGSYDNIDAILKDEVNFAIAQFDVFLNAKNAKDDFYGMKPKKDLRLVVPILAETVNVVVKNDSAFKNFAELVANDKNIALPKSSSSAYLLFNMVENRKLKISDIGGNIKITNTGIGSILRNVCEGKVDAAVFVSSHVNSLLKDYIKSCGLKFIAYNNDTKSFNMIKIDSRYFLAEVPSKMYDSSLKNVSSVGVYSFLITKDIVDDEVVYAFLEQLYNNKDAISKQINFDLNTVRKVLNDKNFDVNLLHKAALKFFKDKGIIKK